MAASTPALPPLTCTARGRRHLQLFVCCKAGHLWPLFLQGLCRAESPPAVSACSALFSRLFVCLPSLPAIPTAHLKFICPIPVALPHSFCFVVLSPVPCHAHQDRRLAGPAVCFQSGPAVCQRRKLSRWQLQHGPAVAARAPVHLLTPSFSCRVHDPGPWR